MHGITQRDVAICTTGATTIQLLDEHMRLFGLQMNNWDSFSDTIRVVNRISVALMLLDATFAIWTWKTIFILHVPIGIIALTWLTRFVIDRRHSQIDRNLEQQKDAIDEEIKESSKKLGYKPLSAKVSFSRRGAIWPTEWGYSPWPDYEYSYYWR